MFPTLTGLPAHPSVFLPRAPPKPVSQLHLTTSGRRDRVSSSIKSGHFRRVGHPLTPAWDSGTYPRGVKLFPARGRGCSGRGGREDGAAAYLGVGSPAARVQRALCARAPSAELGEPLQAPPLANSSPHSSAASLPPVPQRSRRRLCSCGRAREILMRERLAGGGAPPPALSPGLPPPSPRPATPHPPL